MFSLSKLKAYAKKDLRGILRIPQPTFTVFRLVFYLFVTPYVLAKAQLFLLAV